MKSTPYELRCKLVIKYEWYRPQSLQLKVKPKHIEALRERAEELIAEAMAQGFQEGRLSDHVRMDKNDGPDGVEYAGSWSVKRKGQADE